MEETNAVFAALQDLCKNGDVTLLYKASKRAKPVSFKLNDADAPNDIVAAYINDIIQAAL